MKTKIDLRNASIYCRMLDDTVKLCECCECPNSDGSNCLYEAEDDEQKK